MNHKFRRTIVLLSVAASMCCAQEVANPSVSGGPKLQAGVPEAATPVFGERNARYQLCPGDSMDLRFPFSPEFDQTSVTVQPDGFISLQAIGDVHVSGLNLPEVKQLFERVYKNILNQPEITVTLRDFNKPYFIANGQVGRPGKYDLRANTTITEALAIAGGLLPSSKHSQVWVFHRLSDGTVQSKLIDVKRMLAQGNLAEDIRVQPGDTVYVPQNTWSKVKGVIVPSTSVGVTPRF